MILCFFLGYQTPRGQLVYFTIIISIVGLSAIEEEQSESLNLNSPEVPPKKASKSPSRVTMPAKPIRKVGDEINLPLQPNTRSVKISLNEQRRTNSSKILSQETISMPNGSTQGSSLENNLNRINQNKASIQPGSNMMRSSVEYQLLSTKASDLSSNHPSRTSRQKRNVRFNSGNSNTMERQQHLSIDYRENDPQFYQDEGQGPKSSMDHRHKDHRQNNNVFRRNNSSSDNFEFMQQMIRDSHIQSTATGESDAFMQYNQTKSSIQNLHVEEYRPQNSGEMLSQYQSLPSQGMPPAMFQNQVRENIKNILKSHLQNNMGFSKLTIMTFDGDGGQFQKIKLKQDPILIAQNEFFAKYNKNRPQQSRKQKQVAKSMQFVENDLSRPQLHQIQPSLMLRKESIDQKYNNLQIQSCTEDCDEDGYSDVQYTDHEREENARDCQEGNKTPFNQYSMSGKRPQTLFSNNEVMRFDSPRQARAYLHLDDEDPVETHRILANYDYEDQMLLETPIHRLGSKNNSKEFDTFRAKQKGEYSNDQIKEMQMSIRNISTNKKASRRQMPGKVQGVSNKIERKNLESFRADNPIKEEAQNINLSDEEQEFYDKYDKSASFGLIGNNSTEEQRLVKNPTYTRITHASKQMGFPGPSKLGATMGFRNEFSSNNPMMKSMPNLDFLKQKDKSSSIHFDEISGLQDSNHFGGNPLQHSTIFDLNSTTFIQHSKHHGFGSPQLNKHAGLLHDSPTKLHQTRQKIFEEFFIIGVDNDDIATLDWSKTDNQYIQPKTLYLYNEQGSEDCDRRRVVKDFCFPDGIEIKQLKKPGDPRRMITSKAQKILYSSKSVREQCFVFIMNANEEAQSDNSFNQQNQSYLETFPGGTTLDKYYNCICVVFNELVSPDQQEPFSALKGKDLDKKFKDCKIYATKKAYCFMFTNGFYQLHLDVINLLINALKYERLKISSHLVNQDPNLIDQTFTDLLSMLDLPLISLDMKRILNKYYNIELDDNQRDGQQLYLNVGEDIGFIKYDVPPYIDRTFLDCQWFCPTLFSVFTLPNLFKLLSAVLLEKSLVFIGKQALLSSAILGLNSLLYPFKWCLALVPILPHPLIEMLEAPLPILVGITKREYREITLTQDEKDSKIWVFLEQGEILWNKDGQTNPEFNFGYMKEIETEYLNFKKAYEIIYTQDSGMESERSSVSEIDSSQIYNDEIKQNCKTICELIRKSLKTYVLDSLKISYRKSNSKAENFVNDIGELVVRNGRANDREFLDQFVQTQMFATYIEENIKIISSFNIK